MLTEIVEVTRRKICDVKTCILTYFTSRPLVAVQCDVISVVIVVHEKRVHNMVHPQIRGKGHRDANSRSPYQEIADLLWNLPRLNYVRKRPTIAHVVSQLNPLQIFTLYFFTWSVLSY
jgi:hypothetical protein